MHLDPKVKRQYSLNDHLYIEQQHPNKPFVLFDENDKNYPTVNFSHPLFLCELALPFSTVKQALSNRTPCRAQPDRVP